MIRSYTGGGQLQSDWRHCVDFLLSGVDRILHIMLTATRFTDAEKTSVMMNGFPSEEEF